MPCPPPGDLPNPGIVSRSPALQADSLPSEPPTKPKNTGVGSLSLLQGNFPTHKSNGCLLHCRQSLYQLSYQGSPIIISHLFLVVIGSGDGSPRRTSQNPSLRQSQTTALCVCLGFLFVWLSSCLAEWERLVYIVGEKAGNCPQAYRPEK